MIHGPNSGQPSNFAENEEKVFGHDPPFVAIMKTTLYKYKRVSTRQTFVIQVTFAAYGGNIA